ncbi:MAG: neutral zinc metallopeptidase [Bradyrhizobium sp.]
MGQHDCRHSRRDRRSLERDFPGLGTDLCGPEDRAVSQRHQWRQLRARRRRRMGPFYCPPEKRIFLDTSFFRQVETRFHGCSGNACKFTAAYIIAHEAGHHVQNLLGILPRVTRLQQQSGDKAASNALQVKIELQADCLSGVWVNREEKKRPGFL